jgi:hypothetical protein
MAVTTPTRDRLRALAELRPERGRVLSVFFDLDPATFGTAEARASQITSALDSAEREIDADDLDHDTRAQLRDDVDRVRGALDPQHMAAGGARGLAVYASGPADVLEIIGVGVPLETRVEIGPTPFVAPLAVAEGPTRLCVALISAGESRLFVGDTGGLEEVADLQDHIDKRVEDEDRRDHFDAVAAVVLDRLDDYDVLLVGGPQSEQDAFADRLHAYVRERLAGRVSVDLGGATAATVLEAAQPALAHLRNQREQDAVDRLRAGLAREDGLAVAGADAVRAMLEQRRVETLLLTVDRSDEDAVRAALEQDAGILVLPAAPDLVDHGGIAALLRF